MVREKTRRKEASDPADEASAPEAEGTRRREKLDEDVENTLDEIDDILEDNAEDFVRAYVQKGGE